MRATSPGVKIHSQRSAFVCMQIKTTTCVHAVSQFTVAATEGMSWSNKQKTPRGPHVCVCVCVERRKHFSLSAAGSVSADLIEYAEGPVRNQSGRSRRSSTDVDGNKNQDY